MKPFVLSMLVVGAFLFLICSYTIGLYQAGYSTGVNQQYNSWRNALVDNPDSIASIRSEVLLERQIQELRRIRAEKDH